jgi:hypothetical protein
MKDYVVTHYVIGVDEYFIVKANNSKEAINLVYDTLYDKSYRKSNFKAKRLDHMYKYANEYTGRIIII